MQTRMEETAAVATPTLPDAYYWPAVDTSPEH